MASAERARFNPGRIKLYPPCFNPLSSRERSCIFNLLFVRYFPVCVEKGNRMQGVCYNGKEILKNGAVGPKFRSSQLFFVLFFFKDRLNKPLLFKTVFKNVKRSFLPRVFD